MYVVAVQDFNQHATKKRPMSGTQRWDKRQRVCSLVDEGEEEEDEEEEDEMKSAHTAFRLHQLRAKGAAQKEADVAKEKNQVVVKEKELGAAQKNASSSGSTEPLVKPSQATLPSTTLQSTTTTVTRHIAATTPKPTPTKKMLSPDLQLSTLPSLPGASESTSRSGANNQPNKSLQQPEAAPPASQAATTGVTIAPEPDEVVVVSSSTVTSVSQPMRVQQRKGINLGFCRNQQGFNFTGHCFYLLAFLGSLVLICFLMLWMD